MLSQLSYLEDLLILTNRNSSFKDHLLKWHSSYQKNFEKIKKVIGTEVLLCYPDFNKPDSFHLYTDASYHQLEAVVMQDK
jgi:hypothetical protein